MTVYFCHPSSPWEGGPNENTNMLIRVYFQKGTEFDKICKKKNEKGTT
jgi:IS30 family transposase